MFSRTVNLHQLTVGEKFKFILDDIDDANLPDVPNNGVWRNVGDGTVENPLGEFTFTSAELMAEYDGAIHADTWVWQAAQNQILATDANGDGFYDIDDLIFMLDAERYNENSGFDLNDVKALLDSNNFNKAK